MAKLSLNDQWAAIVLACWTVGLSEGWAIMELRTKGYDDRPTVDAARMLYRGLDDVLRRAPPLVKSYKGVPQ